MTVREHAVIDGARLPVALTLSFFERCKLLLVNTRVREL